jgi:hypothetical protein
MPLVIGFAFFIGIVAAITAMPARAADTGNDYALATGNDYIHKCGTVSFRDTYSTAMAVNCGSFAIGVAVGLALGRANPQLKSCIPEAATLNQLREVA